MKKKRKGSKHIRVKKLTILMSSILVILILVAFIIVRQNGDSQKADESKVNKESADQGLELPYLIEGENLEITSMFSYTGLNPDADMQEGEEIAAIGLKNISKSFLAEATVTALFDDGTEQIFVIKDLPAGKETLAFSIDNQKFLSSDFCEGITVETVFEENEQNEEVEISVDGATITVTNISEENLSGIDVYYRDVYEDKYFGGTTHKDFIETLPKGESATITVQKSIWGVVDVARIEIK